MMKKLKAKERVELEKKFLSSILAAADDGDIREKAARYRVSWRYFRDKRHRAIWRALEALDLRTLEERQETIMAELDELDNSKTLGTGYHKPQEVLGINRRNVKQRVETPSMGEPGSAARKEYLDELEEKSKGLVWLERELDAAGALGVVGGKKYLREVAAAYPVTVDAVAEGLAKQLGFM